MSKLSHAAAYPHILLPAYRGPDPINTLSVCCSQSPGSVLQSEHRTKQSRFTTKVLVLTERFSRDQMAGNREPSPVREARPAVIGRMKSARPWTLSTEMALHDSSWLELKDTPRKIKHRPYQGASELFTSRKRLQTPPGCFQEKGFL